MQAWSQTAIEKMKADTPKGSGALAASIDFDFGADGGVLTVDFLADDYWDYVNSGVDGFSNSAGAIKNKFGETYSFNSAYPSQKMVDSLLGKDKRSWFASKGINSYTWTDKEGNKHTQIMKDDDDYQALAYMFGIAIKQKGIKPSNFVASGINENSIKQLEELLIEAIANLF